MHAEVQSLADLIAGAPAAGHELLYHLTGGWKTVAGRVFDARAYGAVLDDATDDTAAVQAAIDAAVVAGGGIVEVPGPAYIGTKTTQSGVSACLKIAGDNVWLRGTTKRSQLRTDQAAFLVWTGGEGKPAGFAGWNTHLYSQATVYPITGGTRNATSVTLANAGDAANFAVGDWVYLRTGQLVAASTNEPDSEINRVVSVVGAVINLRWPLAKDYAQEYYHAGASGFTNREETGNTAAPFGIAKVTDRTLQNVAITDLKLTGTGNNSLIHGTQVVNYRRERNVVTCLASAFSEDTYRYGWLCDNEIAVTGTGAAASVFTAAKGTGNAYFLRNVCSGQRVLNVQLNEGCFDCYVLFNAINSKPSVADEHVIDSRTRGRNIVIAFNTIRNAGNTSAIFVSPGTYDESVNGGSGIVAFNVVEGGNFSIAVQSQATGWLLHPNLINPIAGATAALVVNRNKGSQQQQPRQQIGGWVTVAQQSTYLGRLPAGADVVDVRLHVGQAGNDSGTDTVSIGYSGDHTYFSNAVDVSATGLKAPTLAHAGINATGREVYAYYAGQNADATTLKVYASLIYDPAPESP